MILCQGYVGGIPALRGKLDQIIITVLFICLPFDSLQSTFSLDHPDNQEGAEEAFSDEESSLRGSAGPSSWVF